MSVRLMVAHTLHAAGREGGREGERLTEQRGQKNTNFNPRFSKISQYGRTQYNNYYRDGTILKYSLYMKYRSVCTRSSRIKTSPYNYIHHVHFAGKKSFITVQYHSQFQHFKGLEDR